VMILLDVVLKVLKVVVCVPCVQWMLLCILEAVECELGLLKVLEATRCILLCKLEVVKSVISFRCFEISIVAVFPLQYAL